MLALTTNLAKGDSRVSGLVQSALCRVLGYAESPLECVWMQADPVHLEEVDSA